MITRNIIILPPPEVAERAMAWSRKIAEKYKTDFVLDGKNYYPHITLYQLALSDANSVSLDQQLHSIVSDTKSFQIEADIFSTLVGFVFLNFKKSNELFSLHEQIVNSCNPLRDGENIPAEVQNLTNPDVPEFIKQSIRTYGSALAMKAYLPHISITRLKTFSEADSARMKLANASIIFDVHSIHVANIGPDGTVNEILQEYPFQ